MLTDLPQELMTPDEAAKWFRRSTSWLRQQKDLLHLGGRGQPLYHVRVCRAYVLARLRNLPPDALRAAQLAALAAACGLEAAATNGHNPAFAPPAEAQPCSIPTPAP